MNEIKCNLHKCIFYNEAEEYNCDGGHFEPGEHDECYEVYKPKAPQPIRAELKQEPEFIRLNDSWSSIKRIDEISEIRKHNETCINIDNVAYDCDTKINRDNEYERIWDILNPKERIDEK